MQIAVMTDFQPIALRFGETPDIGHHPVMLPRQRIGGGVHVRMVLVPRQLFEHALGSAEQTVAPLREVRRCHRLRRERGNVGPACQRLMQLRGATSDLPHALQQHLILQLLSTGDLAKCHRQVRRVLHHGIL